MRPPRSSAHVTFLVGFGLLHSSLYSTTTTTTTTMARTKMTDTDATEKTQTQTSGYALPMLAHQLSTYSPPHDLARIKHIQLNNRNLKTGIVLPSYKSMHTTRQTPVLHPVIRWK